MSVSTCAPRITCPECGARVTLRRAATRWDPGATHRVMTRHWHDGVQCPLGGTRYDVTSEQALIEGKPCRAYPLDQANATDELVRRAYDVVEGDDDVVSFGLRLARLAIAVRDHRTITGGR
jgi:hypothetical protein